MDMQESGAVPIGYDSSGALVRPEDARRGEAYRCPGCGAPVVLRRGERRRPHFAHRGGEGCSAESVLHRTAKELVIELISNWKGADGPRPSVSRPCPSPGCDGGIVQDLPDDVTHALPEVRLGDGSIADVVLYRGESPAVAVEIVVTHRVSDAKARRLRLPWMELLADDLLDRPYWWVVVQDGLNPFECPSCQRQDRARSSTVAEIAGRARRVAEQSAVYLPPSPPYRFVPHTCWRCAESMVVYLWPGGGGHSRVRPPAPIPSSLELRATDWGGDHWANCCPSCSAVQGDHYLLRDNTDYAVVHELYRSEPWTP